IRDATVTGVQTCALPISNIPHTPRVLHLSTYDAQDGASRGSTWLNEALRCRGFESSLMVGRKRSDDPTILPLPGPIAPVMSALRSEERRVGNECTYRWLQ